MYCSCVVVRYFLFIDNYCESFTRRNTNMRISTPISYFSNINNFASRSISILRCSHQSNFSYVQFSSWWPRMCLLVTLNIPLLTILLIEFIISRWELFTQFSVGIFSHEFPLQVSLAVAPYFNGSALELEVCYHIFYNTWNSIYSNHIL